MAERDKAKEKIFNSQLKDLLNNFEKNKEWADIGNWLQRIENLLRDFKIPYIADKITFSKRLAQCLNPIIPPGTHQQALSVYELLFNNMGITYSEKQGTVITQKYIKNFAEDIGIYSLGLFPFFQSASVQIKPKILEIIRKYYFPLKLEIIPCIPGLVMSLLSGIDEQNEALLNDVLRTFEDAEKCVGKKYVVGAVWMAILRSPKNRAAGLKYLLKTFPKLRHDQGSDDDFEEEDEIVVEEEDDEEEEEDEEQEIKERHKDSDINDKNLRNSSKMNEIDKNVLSSSIIEKNEGMNEESSKPLVEGSHETKKKLMNEIEEEFKSEESYSIDILYPNKSTLVISSILACLDDENTHVEKLALDFMYAHIKLTGEEFTEEDKLLLVEACMRNLIKNDAKDHRRIFDWLFGKRFESKCYNIENEKVRSLIIKSLKNILANVTSKDEIWNPLKIVQEFYRDLVYIVESTVKHLCVPIYTHIYKFKDYKEKSGASFLDKGKRFHLNVSSYKEHILVSFFDTLEQNIKEYNDEECIHIIKLLNFYINDVGLKFSQNCLENSIMKILEVCMNFQKEDLVKFQFLYPAFELALKINDILGNEGQIEVKGVGPNILAPNKTFNEILQKFSDLFSLMVDELSNSNEVDKFVNLFTNFSKILVTIQRFLDVKEMEQLPMWFELIVKCLRNQNKQICIRAIETIVDIMSSREKDDIYSNLHDLIIQNCKNIRKQKEKDYATNIFEILWTYLDYHVYQNKIVELMINFKSYFPDIFEEVSAEQLSVKEVQEKETAIRRFATFWKKTSQSPTIRDNDLNQALFKMLDYLNDDNPLIRHTTKSWLNDSKEKLGRVLDPLFEVLLLPNHQTEVNENDETIYTEEYNPSEILQALRRIKSIWVENVGFFNYISNNKPNQNVINEFENCFNIPKNDIKYIDVLASIGLHLLQGRTKENVSDFAQKNFLVNSSSSEMLEYLFGQTKLTKIDSNITVYLIHPLLKILENAINIHNIIMQVQVISLLKLLFFHSVYENAGGDQNLPPDLKKLRKKEMEELVKSSNFMDIFLQGVKTEISYMKVEFINFITKLINIIPDYQKEDLIKNIKSTLETYFQLIRDLKQNEEKEVEDFEISNIESDMIKKKLTLEKKTLNHSMLDQSSGAHQLGLSSDKKKNFNINIKMDNPFSEIQQNQTLIFELLEAIKIILNYFLKFMEDPTSYIASVFSKHDKKSRIKDLTAELDPTIILFIFCWRTSQNFLNQFDKNGFTNCGISANLGTNTGEIYEFEKIAKNASAVFYKDSKVIVEVSTIKGQIISVLDRLLNHTQYTTQTINSFVDSWIKECEENIKDNSKVNANSTMKKQIETLVMLNLSPDFFLASLAKSSVIASIKNFYSNTNNWKKKKEIYLDYECALKESRVLFFVYTYFTYTFKNEKINENMIKIWKELISFLDLFENSYNPNTLFWIIEIIYLVNRKYWPQEALSEKNFKKLLITKTNKIMLSIANVACKTVDLKYQSLNQKSKSDSSEGINYKIIKPLPPCIYDMYNQFKSRGDIQDVEQKSEGYEYDLCFEIFSKNNFANNNEAIQAHRLMGFKILNNLLKKILLGDYQGEEKQKAVERLKPVMDIVFQIFSDKSDPNRIFVECASELLSGLFTNSDQIFVEKYWKNVYDIFNLNDFFKCTNKALKNWSSIIKTLYSINKDKYGLFSELLSKLSLYNTLFNKDAEIKKRIKNFQRICFVIYSGDKDKYSTNLDSLLEKIRDVIKNPEATDKSLLILIIFCMRILFLSLTTKALNTLFKTLWPMILSLLMTIFNLKKENEDPKILNLTLSALKLIELISFLQLEEFYLHQWIFVFDYFGIKIEENVVKEKFQAPFEYEPYIMNCLPSDKVMKYANLEKQEKDNMFPKKKKDIIITESYIESEEQLKAKALSLSNHLIMFNEHRSQLDAEPVKRLIEDDFIKLDEYLI